MSKLDFGAEEFASRTTRLQEAMVKERLDWLLVTHPVSMRWLIGQDTKSYAGFEVLFVSAETGRRIILTREMDRNEFEEDTLADEVRTYGGGEPEDPLAVFRSMVDQLGLKARRVGLEVPSWYLNAHHYIAIKADLGKALAAEPNGMIPSIRLRKSPKEIEYHRKSAKIADEAFAVMADAIAEGVSELELAGIAYRAVLKRGSAIPASTFNLTTGERTCFAIGGPTERKMRPGDSGLVEFGAAFRRYHCSLGRTWCLGDPSLRLLELQRLLQAASQSIISEMRGGVPAVVPHEAGKRIIAEAGLDRFRKHTSGYGMGQGFPPSWGDPINMFGGSQDTLQAGMVVSVEPGVYIKEERIGLRLIDTVLITETGVERLTQFPSDLVIVPC